MIKSKIAIRNDKFRESLIQDQTHRLYSTDLVNSHDKREAILQAVREFDGFNDDNDPHEEHDFGMVLVEGEKFYFKCDYYDLNLEYGADPSEVEYCVVLTIMGVREY